MEIKYIQPELLLTQRNGVYIATLLGPLKEVTPSSFYLVIYNGAYIIASSKDTLNKVVERCKFKPAGLISWLVDCWRLHSIRLEWVQDYDEYMSELRLELL